MKNRKQKTEVSEEIVEEADQSKLKPFIGL
jgi:hypothetical protein